MIVVSDASPLISLTAVRHLGLLPLLYGEVLVPPAVYHEVVSSPPDAVGASEVGAARWIQVREVEDRPLVEALSVNLDAGEAEAIALAVETGADLLLVDERRARAIARRLGQRVIGVLGVVLEAKVKGLLPEVRPVLEELSASAGFRISATLYARVLEAAGE